MIEIPESRTIACQICQTLRGRTLTGVFAATHPHRFTWWAGDPHAYPALLTGRRIVSAAGCGAFIILELDDDTRLALSDGVNLRLCVEQAAVPNRYQLLLTLDDGRFWVITVAMYGGILAFKGTLDNPYLQGAVEKPSPLDEAFDADHFERLRADSRANLSVKAFLATEQRIPGLGNGVLQDILFRAGIHPKRKMNTLGDAAFENLFRVLKSLLAEMTRLGGRDTEKDLFGNPGGYRVLLSKNTWSEPCPRCGGGIVREAYMGGTVYFCPACQPLE